MATVLVVDAAEDVLVDALGCRGHRVAHCADAAAARRLVADLRPDALVVRLRGTSPHVVDFDGLLALPRELRGDAATSAVRLIAIGNPSGAGRFRRGIATDAGFDHELHILSDAPELFRIVDASADRATE